MNRFNPQKLLNSKWTAVTPQNKEKHFVVVEVDYDEQTSELLSCVIEAVLTKRQCPIDWRALKNSKQWQLGWK
ncbi:TIGR02450 family Trp-rich protein [Paraferrimonas sp. SM1919]|uniref:TIGR02450 family Trp-rich protein n=1 Tax=Paraferrimonas sp. SM1919 TaxID=2662263 RepID=UPI0013CF8796|nr:TIGR02450 family Trp-rich protein [Paraferrimonas sp. SM1919]